MAQQPFGHVCAAIRTDADPFALASAARAAVRELDRELPVAELRTMDDIAAAALAERRFAGWLFDSFAVLALASFGIYGLLAYTLQQRRKELGIRSALGATPASLVRLVLRDGTALAGAGIAAGLLLVPIPGRLLSTLRYGVTATDAIALSTAPLLVLAIALSASALPAYSAARSDALSALREE